MKIVVVGAGVGGLAAAARLAAAGHRVVVFERAETVGGKLSRLVRRTGAGEFRFDTGPNLLTLPSIAADLFAATGSGIDEHLRLVRLDPIARHRFADGTVLDSGGRPEEFAARVGEVFGRDAESDWWRLWRRAERVWQAAWRHVLTVPADSPLALARLAWRLHDLRAVAPGQTLRGAGRATVRDPRLRMLIDRYATYAGADPRRAPAALLAIPYAEMRYGGWYLRGGVSTLADALALRCADLGVAIHTGTAVTRIEVNGGRVTGVRVAGGRVPADAVVANADALCVYRDLCPDPRRAAALRERSLSGFVMLLGVRGHTPGLAHHTLLFPADTDAEFDAVFGDPPRGRLARPADDPTVLVSVPADPSVCPPGHEAWFVLVNAAPHGDTASTVDWRAAGLAERYADRILALLAERGLDVRDRILFRETRTPADLAAATATPGGAIYGSAGHGWHGLRRPPNRGRVRGLFLVGGSVHPAGGLPMVMLSARIVANLID
jgi:phytoene desaturase